MRILGTILSGMCLFAWVAYLSWPVSADAPASGAGRPVETRRANAEWTPPVDLVPISDNIEPSV
jgi:hypothetical protein